MRFPVALKIALATAAATPTIPTSPMPFTPSLFTCLSFSSIKKIKEPEVGINSYYFSNYRMKPKRRVVF